MNLAQAVDTKAVIITERWEITKITNSWAILDLKKCYQNSSEAKIQIHVGQPSKTFQTVDFAKPLYSRNNNFFISECDLTRSGDIHGYETRGQYSAGIHLFSFLPYKLLKGFRR